MKRNDFVSRKTLHEERKRKNHFEGNYLHLSDKGSCQLTSVEFECCIYLESAAEKEQPIYLHSTQQTTVGHHCLAASNSQKIKALLSLYTNFAILM